MQLANDLRHGLDAARFAREALDLDLDAWQETVLTTPSKRLLMNVTRQGGKSTVAAAKGLHRAVFVPGSLVLMVSPSLRQSSELYRRWRALADRLPALALVEDTKTSCTLANGSRVVSLPSTEATIRGYASVDLLLFDEASRVEDALYGACRPMVSVSNGDIAAMTTPWGQRGWFWEAWERGGSRWERFEVAAPDCPRISPAFLEEERQSLPPLFFESEYLCRFADTEDSVFRTEDLDKAFNPIVTPLFGASHVSD